MILRILGSLALILGAAAVMFYLSFMGKGPWTTPEARHLRALKDRRVAPARYEPLTMGDVQRLPHQLSLAAYAPLEARGVSYEGYVQRILRAIDDDCHLEVTPTPRGSAGPDTAYVTAEITPWWRQHSQRWSYEGLVAAFRPNHGGASPWDDGPRRVRVSGWLLYDFQYDTRVSPWSLQYQAPRVSGWEIHPVTRIELWDDARQSWVDDPR